MPLIRELNKELNKGSGRGSNKRKNIQTRKSKLKSWELQGI